MFVAIIRVRQSRSINIYKKKKKTESVTLNINKLFRWPCAVFGYF